MLPFLGGFNGNYGSLLADIVIKKMVVAEYGDGRVMKMEEDLSNDVEELLKETAAMQNEGNWEQAVELMCNLEKKTRLVADSRSNARLQVAIVTTCFKANQMPALISNITNLCKKRSVIKVAMSEMVRACYDFLKSVDDKEAKLSLIEVLMNVTNGKIYVEVERARLTVMLATIMEDSGDMEGAKQTLLDLQVESCGSMEKREKVAILLHQLRLCIALDDFVRASMVAKKISPKVFTDEDDEMQKMHIQYHELIIKVDQHEENYLAISRHYHALSRIPMIANNPQSYDLALKNLIVFALLAAHDNQQYDLLKRIASEKTYDAVPEYRDLVRLFARQELLNWTKEVVIPYETLLRVGSDVCPCTGLFDGSKESGQKLWQNLKIRAGEHSMRMIAKYYSRITLDRMAELLDWDRRSTEQFLCRLIVGGTIEGAKIDRPSGVVCFKREPTFLEKMDDWVLANGRLMDQMSKAAHLISKEEMLQRTFGM